MVFFFVFLFIIMYNVDVSKKDNLPDFACPNCGMPVSGGAKACPHCGSDEETGWAEGSEFSYMDPTFDEKDYEDMKNREFGGQKKKNVYDYLIPATAAVLLGVWLYYSFF